MAPRRARLARGQRGRQSRAHVEVEERQVVARLADRRPPRGPGSPRARRSAPPPGAMSDGSDDGSAMIRRTLPLAHPLGERAQRLRPRAARPGVGSIGGHDREAEASREVGPGVVRHHHARPRSGAIAACQRARPASSRSQEAGAVGRRRRAASAGARRASAAEDGRGHGARVLGIEPVVRIAEAVHVPAALGRARAASRSGAARRRARRRDRAGPPGQESGFADRAERARAATARGRGRCAPAARRPREPASCAGLDLDGVRIVERRAPGSRRARASPPTASTSALRSVVVVTTGRGAAAPRGGGGQHRTAASAGERAAHRLLLG